jgi:hypothetical protein
VELEAREVNSAPELKALHEIEMNVVLDLMETIDRYVDKRVQELLAVTHKPAVNSLRPA